MEKFAEWWVNEGALSPCCQQADPEVVETDAEQFNCDTCPVRQVLDELDADNFAAWQLFRSLCTRFLVETRSVSVALSRLTAHLDPDEFRDLTARLAILHEAYYPPSRKSNDG